MNKNQIIYIDNKPHIKCGIVILQTNNISPFYLDNIIGLVKSPKDRLIPGLKYQHLYITLNEEIKEGDYCIDAGELFGPYNRIDTLIGPSYKVIATTDTSLHIEESCTGYTETRSRTFYSKNPLPQPSQQFIEKYIKEYNKGNKVKYVCKNCNEKYSYQPLFCNDCGCKFSTETFIINKSNIITEVLVEVELINKKEYIDEQDAYGYDNFIYKLKLDSQNQITIRKQKDSWSEGEVIKLCQKCWKDARESYYIEHSQTRQIEQTFDEWIKENL